MGRPTLFNGVPHETCHWTVGVCDSVYLTCTHNDGCNFEGILTVSVIRPISLGHYSLCGNCVVCNKLCKKRKDFKDWSKRRKNFQPWTFHNFLKQVLRRWRFCSVEFLSDINWLNPFKRSRLMWNWLLQRRAANWMTFKFEGWPWYDVFDISIFWTDWFVVTMTNDRLLLQICTCCFSQVFIACL